MAKKAEVW